MENKNSKLDILFDEWKNFSQHQMFFSDGIVNEKKFTTKKTKILFVTKEPNYSEVDDELHDYRQWWSTEEGLYDRFTYRIVEWAYGILNGFPVFNTIWPRIDGKYDSSNALEALASIAFMNIKKSGGGGTSNRIELNDYLAEHRSFVLKEIEIIQPDLIILGLSWQSTVDLIFGSLDWQKTGYEVDVARFMSQKVNTRIIDFYHPSTRSSAAALYCLLEKVYSSETFKIL